MSEYNHRTSAAVRTLESTGYTYHGGGLWKPPLGLSSLPLRDAMDRQEVRIGELEAKLRALREQKPFTHYYRHQSPFDGSFFWSSAITYNGVHSTEAMRLYADPVPPRDLSDEEIKSIFRKSISEQGRQIDFVVIGQAIIKAAREAV
jgi:hypothetical protein